MKCFIFHYDGQQTYIALNTEEIALKMKNNR